MSELYGRMRVLQGANLLYLVFNLVCAFAKTKGQFIAFRFISGLGGGAPLSIGAGVLSDLWRPEERGRGAALYSLMPLLGPALGPLLSGQIAQVMLSLMAVCSKPFRSSSVPTLGSPQLQLARRRLEMGLLLDHYRE
jgi:MFS family permease